ncbi:MAG TPA: DUF554 family protein [Verrucomicrobiota bacterium]|jgi:uncharacterized membrane protein YqgA involved in biofilm formation|nr:DUF554 family protein [Verrucomicrobiota bacterium]HQL80010.1 DUF554 family protein [Verrucomicrobiota bacterium]
MIGTALNVAGILIGGVVGLVRRKPFSPARESFLKVALGAFTVFYGLRLTWVSLNGSLWQILKQLLIAVLALMLGRLTGRLLRLQKMSNHLGREARERIAATKPADPGRLSDGFKTCAALYCAAPLALLGALQDGLSGYYYPLAVKAVMDGLGTMGFALLFGWGVLMSALPVLAFQGTITLVCAQYLRPFLEAHGLVDSVNAVGGLLVFCVALLIFEIRRIEVTDYLPALIFAPLLTFLLK